VRGAKHVAGPFAMQKVVGSNPISRFQRRPRKAGVSWDSDQHLPWARHTGVNAWVNTLQARLTLDGDEERVLRREANGWLSDYRTLARGRRGSGEAR
jgi:hypothetical protein